ALLATLFFADGTPMLLAGDEFGRSQSGNNNAYCQDGPLSWLDWEQAASPEGRKLSLYVARLIALRRAHPSLRAGRYLDPQAELAPGLPRSACFEPGGQPLSEWEAGRALALRRVAPRPDGTLDVTLLLLNPNGQDEAFALPEPALAWMRDLDSAASLPVAPQPAGPVRVQAHSVVLLSAVGDAQS
ncbi:glycogen debranching enzyme GlgX, partial [Bordetella hinzii]|nr:glycogen debranching enzyme GlgX [Bordetella hinzii]